MVAVIGVMLYDFDFLNPFLWPPCLPYGQNPSAAMPRKIVRQSDATLGYSSAT